MADPTCPYQGKYKLDCRCRDWYIQTAASTGGKSIIFLQIMENDYIIILGVTFVPPYTSFDNTTLIETTVCGKISKDGKTYLIICFDLEVSQWLEQFSADNFEYSNTFLIFPGTLKVLF